MSDQGNQQVELEKSPSEARPAARSVRTGPDERRASERPNIGSSRYGYTFRRLLLASDVLAILLSSLVAILAASIFTPGETTADWWAAPGAGAWWGSLALMAVFWVGLAYGFGLYHQHDYRIDIGLVDEFWPTVMVSSVSLWAFVLFRAAVSPYPAELLGPAVLWISTVILVLFLRSVDRLLARGKDWFRQSVVVIGRPYDIERVLVRIRRHPEWGLDPLATVLRNAPGESSVHLIAPEGQDLAELEQKLATAGDSNAELASLVSFLGADRVIVIAGDLDLAAKTDLVRSLVDRRLAVDFVSGGPESLFTTADLHNLEGMPVLSIKPSAPGGLASAIKRFMDIVVAAAALAITSPVLALAAIAIKLDTKGPILFSHPRAGYRGREFSFLKLRTMVEDADERRDEVRGESIHAEGEGMLKVVDDPRITRVGRILRRWSLDEFPQLWNVLRGDMSLVGPRPLPLDEAVKVPPDFEVRCEVRPGLTGPWQVMGRSDIPFDDMLRLDYTYVVGWSLNQDFLLLLRTAGAVIRGKGVY